MVVGRFVRNRSNSSTLPVLHDGRIRILRHEGKAFLEVAKTCDVCGDGVQEVSHWCVTCTIPNEDEVEQSGRIVDEIRHDAPSQIELSEIVVGYNQIRGSGLITVECTMNMKDTSKIVSATRFRDSPESISLNRRTRSLCSILEEEIEVGRYDCGRTTAVGKTHQCLVNWGRLDGRIKQFRRYRLPNAALVMRPPIHPPFKHA